MPRGDRTGPMGQGPMTGRAAGYCAGYPVPGYMNPISGRGRGFGFGRGWGRGRGRGRGGGFGWGRGWGRGWGWQGEAYPHAYGAPYYGPAYGYPYAQEPTAKEEMDILREESEALKQHLQDIQERINTLESAEKEKK